MKKHLTALIFCLMSFLVVQTSIQGVELSSAQMSLLQGLNLTGEKLEAKEPAEAKEEFVQALSNEIAVRSTDSSDLPSTVAHLYYGYRPYLVVVPISEGWSYIDGARCHVGNYAEFSMITVFEGINTGCQLTLAYDGRVLFVNPYHSINITPGGVIYNHVYDNATVVTGVNQVMYVFQ